MLTITDFINILHCYYKSPMVSANTEKFRLSGARRVLQNTLYLFLLDTLDLVTLSLVLFYVIHGNLLFIVVIRLVPFGIF